MTKSTIQPKLPCDAPPATPLLANRHRIRDLNEAFRAAGGTTGRVFVTCGVNELGFDFVVLALAAVRQFDGFDQANDPHGEHDFGSLHLADEHLFWKIDYYDRSFSFGSPDPADPAQTARVLTVMLASEY